MLDTVKINHVQHISFTQSRLTDAVSVILSELLSYEHPSNFAEGFLCFWGNRGEGCMKMEDGKAEQTAAGLDCCCTEETFYTPADCRKKSAVVQ